MNCSFFFTDSGQKHNPLRQRLDSYDYTVEQHVVGSLLFTPLLLLIPTTSVFYIFFTSLITTIIFLTIIFEISISLLHATPYAEIWVWIMIRRRFPSGIWFEVLDCDNGITDEVNSHTCLDGRQCDSFLGGETSSLVSLLCSNYATIGNKSKFSVVIFFVFSGKIWIMPNLPVVL